MSERFDRIDRAITEWLARRSILILRIALGIVFRESVIVELCEL